MRDRLRPARDRRSELTIAGHRWAIVAVLGALFIACPALAAPPPAGGWGFAHWGMTRDAVRAASHGRAHAESDDMDTNTDVVDGGGTIDGLKFAVRLEYAASGLAQIDFHLLGTAAECKALGAYLRDTYGAHPTEETSEAFDTLIWDDPASGNTIAWSRMGDGGEVCDVAYDPLSTANDIR